MKKLNNNNTQKRNTQLSKIKGLWKAKGSRGEYFKFTIGDRTFMIFPNGYKTEEKHPDYILYEVLDLDLETGEITSKSS